MRCPAFVVAAALAATAARGGAPPRGAVGRVGAEAPLPVPQVPRIPWPAVAVAATGDAETLAIAAAGSISSHHRRLIRTHAAAPGAGAGPPAAAIAGQPTGAGGSTAAMLQNQPGAAPEDRGAAGGAEEEGPRAAGAAAPEAGDAEEEETHGTDEGPEESEDEAEPDAEEHDESEESLVEEEVAEGHGAARTVGALLRTQGFVDCANYSGNCTCDGVVLYGKNSNWSSLRVNGTVRCMGDNFGDASPDTTKGCRCYDMLWCEENRPATGGVTDTAHRRRDNAGAQGINMHQRRRWCGWGPRNCLWSDWSEYGPCSTTCGNGTRSRSRSQQTAEENGGACTGSPVETEPCDKGHCPGHP